MQTNNWTNEETKGHLHKQAKKQAAIRSKYEKGRKFKQEKHPTAPRAIILKEIK